MIKRKRSINSIIHDQLLGYASEEDKKQLQSWLDSSQENRENYDRLMREACLIDRYKQFAQVDEARAWERFQKKAFLYSLCSLDQNRTVCGYLLIADNWFCNMVLDFAADGFSAGDFG